MNPEAILKQYFGYDEFREGQKKLIDQILMGQDVLGIMPTGAGKSICYQVPALIFSGITVVISPLISLMKDQVYSLNQAGIHAAYINSSLSEAQIAKAFANAKAGIYKIVYVAPERLTSALFLDFIQQADIAMVAVDEAHCVSQWGQDFRPGYLDIAPFIEKLGKRPVVCAFTATATEQVKEDIICILGLARPAVVITGFDRQNLYFAVEHSRDKKKAALEYVKKHENQCGIIYCATRKNVEEIYELLCDSGIPAAKYHAGMSNEERVQSQDDFIYDVKNVMVATNAFGMGIDKSNVRYVLHLNMPQSMEHYYQEAGRAGRDGENAECMLLYAPRDIVTNRYFIDNKESKKELTREEEAAIKERDLKRLHQMTRYCTTKECLRSYILKYFGEETKGDCNYCSNCLTEYEKTDVTEIAKAVMNCVYEVRQRFGVNIIIGILRGSKAARIVDNGFDVLKSYNSLALYSESTIRQVLDVLFQENLLIQTNADYPVIQMGPEYHRLEEDTYKVYIKSEIRPAKASSKQDTKGQLTDKGRELFEKLRRLRYEIAQEERVPPYIVFSDKTLVDMCVRLPLTREQMLEVSGVGHNKNEKYGTKFIEIISREIKQSAKDSFVLEEASSDTIQPERRRPERPRKRRRDKADFAFTPEMAPNVDCSGECTISGLVGKINALVDKSEMNRCVIRRVVEKLEEEGYFHRQGRTIFNARKIQEIVLYEKGASNGFFITEKISAQGLRYPVLMLNEKAQKHLVEKMLEWQREYLQSI